MRGFHGSRQMPGGEPQAPAAGGQHHATLQLHYLMMDCNDSALNTEKSSPPTRTPLDPFNSPSLGNTSFPVLSSYTLYTTTLPPLTPPSWGSLLSPPPNIPPAQRTAIRTVACCPILPPPSHTQGSLHKTVSQYLQRI